VAVKLVAPGFAASPEAVGRFHREGRLASIIAHPRCVFVLAADEEAGRPYIVMELMPGRTLADLVREQGPLPPEQAVRLILDVIEGLQEAHRLQVIHRDVKPSNCFLEPDGRVKIGDFGLSKSLVADAHLTQAGSFLGTPHFASPEQHKGEDIDLRSDVYSVAATLYFLLTGKPPFHQSDSLAAVAARKASEPAAPMRSLRPELPAALDRVVLRGLERDRERRWRNLDELRTALLPFVPGHLSIGAMGMRLAAYMVDGLLYQFVGLVLALGVLLLFFVADNDPDQNLFWVVTVGLPLTWVAYFTILEGVWGCSLGKRFLRLRVSTPGGTEAPGLARSLWRMVLFYTLLSLGGWITVILKGLGELEFFPEGQIAAIPLVVFAAGLGLMTCTMRARNGYRGLHEFLSGTRTIQLPWPASSRYFHTDPVDLTLSRPERLPERVGPFVVHGLWRRTAAEQILLGEDPALGRKVWLWLHAPGDPLFSPARRQIARMTRLRWLAGGREGEDAWDALLAPVGCPVADLIEKEGRLSWAEVRPLLDQLGEELELASREGTLPSRLTLCQLWVDRHGRVQLLDIPLEAPTGASAMTGGPDGLLHLLGQVAALALEGKPRPAGEPPFPIRAPVPEHASAILDRLVGVRSPYRQVSQFLADLAATQDRPTQMSLTLRGGHLALLAPLLAFAVFTIWSLSVPLRGSPDAGHDAVFDYVSVAALAGLVVLWMIWAFLFRGGLTFRLMGIALVRSDGSRASRRRCAWRTFLLWAPFVSLYGLVLWLFGKEWGMLFGLLALLCLLCLYLVLGLVFPRRPPQDFLAGTYLVPR
jgi:hypothetical protein